MKRIIKWDIEKVPIRRSFISIYEMTQARCMKLQSLRKWMFMFHPTGFIITSLL